MSASLSAGESRDNGLQAIWSRLRANPKIPLLVAASAAIAIIVALLLWAKSPDYRVLYSNLNDRDGGAIVTQLTQMNIPYRFAENGAALMIPAEKVHETRLRLAQQGLPKGGAVGFELLDQENSASASSANRLTISALLKANSHALSNRWGRCRMRGCTWRCRSPRCSSASKSPLPLLSP